jgi:pyruvate,orthophosphate dikinase
MGLQLGNGKAEGRAGTRDLLGGKGAGLAEMANLGSPVPPGFTITTAVCTHYYANGKTYPRASRTTSPLRWQTSAASPARGSGTARIRCWWVRLARAPRCRARWTPCQFGLNDTTVEALRGNPATSASPTIRPPLHHDVFRRGAGIGHHHFEEILDDCKDRNGYTSTPI